MKKKLYLISERPLFFVMILWMVFLNCNSAFAQAAYTASDLRDPFASQLPGVPLQSGDPLSQTPAAAQEVTPPQIEVESIVSGGPVPLAIIKGKIVRIGNEIEGALITDITKNGVEVLYKVPAPESESKAQEVKFLIPAPSRRILGDKKGGEDAK